MLELNIISTPESEIEMWKSLSDLKFPQYDISSYGRVRNSKTGKILKLNINQSNYHKVSLTDNNKIPTSVYIHILVAKTFISQRPSDEYTVDHIDRNPGNNYYRNLRWATKEQQSINRNKRAKGIGRPVNQYNLDGTFIKQWITAAEAGTALGTKDQGRNISAVCRGKKNLTAGFIWRYVDEIVSLDGEIWLHIPYTEYGDIYISNMGRIKLGSGRISYGSTTMNGYKSVSLKNLQTNTNCNFLIHRLIMETFVGPQANLQVNHKDGNKINNKLDNLEYVTSSENSLHAHSIGLVNQYCHPVIRVTVNTGEEITYSSIAEASRLNDLSRTAIRARCMGSIKSNGENGYFWKYKDMKSSQMNTAQSLTLNIIR
jgi:hypothetical protein